MSEEEVVLPLFQGIYAAVCLRLGLARSCLISPLAD